MKILERVGAIRQKHFSSEKQYERQRSVIGYKSVVCSFDDMLKEAIARQAAINDIDRLRDRVAN